MNRFSLIFVVLMIVMAAPNCIWLVRSTARITNAGADRLDAVIVHVGDEKVVLGELSPGERKFILLPASGEAIYQVRFVKAGQRKMVCQEYVEGAMYHVETILLGIKGSNCTVSFPLISDLLIWKAL